MPVIPRDLSKPLHAWTRRYWPAALVLAVVAFFVPFLAGWGLLATGLGLSAGALLLGIPELACLISGNPQDTLSYWVWRIAHVTSGGAIDTWDAAHVLFIGGYLLVVGSVQYYLFTLAQAYWQVWLLFGAGVFFFGVWLLVHFSERWWT
jgi:hypothetical protein